MQVGQYGKYKGKFYICVENRGNLILIMDCEGGKRQIAQKNFEVREGNVAPIVYYEGTSYLITKDKHIISLNTKKFMKWYDEHPTRQAILNLRGIDRVKQVMKGTQYDLPL